MQKEEIPSQGNNRNAQAINKLASSFSILPPKIPSMPDDSRTSQLMKVRVIPGWDKNGNENQQLDPAALQNPESVENDEDFLGDWVFKIRCFHVRHYNKQTKKETFSWFPAISYRDLGGEDYEPIQSPVAYAAWQWFHGIKPYNKRASQLATQYGFRSKEKFDTLKQEFDLSSVMPVLNVSPAFETYFAQVIPLTIGPEYLDYSNDWGRTLLPIDQVGFKNALINYFTQKRQDKVNYPLSIETTAIGTDVVSLENGWSLGLQRRNTEGYFLAGEPYPLDPADGWLDPNMGAWVPWKDVFEKHSPGALVEDLVSATSKAAVDWALSDSDYECYIPDRIRGAGKEFNLQPVPRTSEPVPDKPEQSQAQPAQEQGSTQSPTQPAQGQARETSTPSKPVASPPVAPQAGSAATEPQVEAGDPEVEEQFNEYVDQMRNSLQEGHSNPSEQ